MMQSQRRCFVPGSFAAFVVREVQQKQKHQQVISGVSLSAYWATTFLWDLATYLLTAACCVALLAAFQVAVYTESVERFGAVVLLFLLFGLSLVPFTYVCSFAFKE